jgi:hypothetical protein
MPLREFPALIDAGMPRDTTNTNVISAAWASASTAEANAQLPGEARE